MPSSSRKPSEVPPQRMGALAKLPVFLDLAGKRAVIAGGTAPAAWKAELLAAAGAAVEVYATEVGPEMQALLERGAASGTLHHHPRSWRPTNLAGAAIAIADAADAVEAAAFFDAARAAGVLVNVIDRPDSCQFQFGAIVNRSPVVVAISTDGGAPILGQAIRQRIEALLPASLAAWGQLAKDVREMVGSRLPTGQLRRRFWERLSRRAFSAPPATDEFRRCSDLLEDLAAGGGAATTGRVTLVGAGPGDAEMLTLQALRALQSADVILYDDLVLGDVLELARREARRIAVGKRGKQMSCAQDDINEMMIELAREGRHVVRLKSGDPMIFGRAGEEIAALKAAGIPVVVVPGITSGIALASRFGVSLTHRDCAQSVRFVTGHGHSSELPEHLDWRGLADPSTTLVFYMSGRTAPDIAQRLIAAGLPATTPAVLLAGATRCDEARWVGKLAALPAGVNRLGRAAPLLIGIGQAFSDAQAPSQSPPTPFNPSVDPALRQLSP